MTDRANFLQTPAPRCFCCGTRHGAADTFGWLTCSTCGAWRRETDDARSSEAAREFAHAVRGNGPFPAKGERDWFVDAFTLRIGATGHERWLTLPGSERIRGHDEAVPQGPLLPLSAAARTDITLVALARSDDPALPRFVAANADRFPSLVLIVDGTLGASSITLPSNVTVVERPLAGDFAAQRNAGMRAVETDWAFHLDLDESVDDRFVASLERLASCAKNAGLQAVGFPRRNFVDGRQSDLYPDIQYRLLGRSERFTGRVHERPEACNDWPSTTIALNGAIDHHLDAKRVGERDALYDAMGQQPARHADGAALMRPYVG